MAGEITQTELQNARLDAITLAQAVTTNATITPRTGAAFSSIPKLVADKGADLDAETANAAAWATSLDVVADGLRGSRYYAQEAAASAAAIGERYIGEFANDALAAAAAADTGALAASDEYFNTTDNRRRVYDGTNWYEPGAPDVTVSIANGGTGATTAEGARAALKAVGVAASYAALTAIVASDRYNTMRVYVQGRAAESDGGEGVWRFDAGSSATANGGTVLAPDAGTGRWLREDYIYYTPEMFGAVGALDDSATIALALAAITAAGGGILGLTADSYFAKGLRPASNTTIMSLTGGKSELKLPAGSALSDSIMLNANPGAFTDSNISLTDIVFDGNEIGDGFGQYRFTEIAGFSRVTNLSVERCEFNNAIYIGGAFAGCRRLTLRDLISRNCGFRGGSETATISIASPAVITIVGHGLPVNQGVRFTTTGALPTGITAGTGYYVKEVLSADTFTITATGGYSPLGAAVVTSGTQSGVHTATTKSGNGGPALWVSNQGADQSTDVLIENILSENHFWAGLHVNALRAKVIGGFIKNVQEAGVFAPNVIGGIVLCDDLLIDGLTVDGVSQSDISSAALELGATNLQVVNCRLRNTDHAGISLLDVDGAIIANNDISNFNIDSKNRNPQAPGVTVLSVASGNAPRNIQIHGNRIYDDQATVTGHTGIFVTGTDPCNNIIIGPNQIADVAWESGEDVILTGFGTGCLAERTQKSGRMLAFTSPGVSSYNKPFGLRGVTVEVIGGGGSGAGAGTSTGQISAGAGGAGGGYARKYIAAASLGATETVTVGAGGAAPAAGNNSGNAGASSSFGSHCSATGGTGGLTSGAAAITGVGGTGAGIGSGGDVNTRGVSGGGTLCVFDNLGASSGAGGASYLGGGAPAAQCFNTTSAVGNATSSPGSGGSGGVSRDGGGSVVGGAGADGIVIVTEHY